jgi:ABC-type transport system involved in multi-copper enzyme maturation permease subunit
MYEGFVSNTENDKIVEQIFTILGYSTLTLVVYGALLWAYYTSEKNQYLFIFVFSLFVLFYAIIIISIVVINKSNYDTLSYSILFGITIFVIFTSFFVAVFFILKNFNLISSAGTAGVAGTATTRTNIDSLGNNMGIVGNAANAVNAEYRRY